LHYVEFRLLIGGRVYSTIAYPRVNAGRLQPGPLGNQLFETPNRFILQDMHEGKIPVSAIRALFEVFLKNISHL
ncbi:MAG: hypothetical protein JXR49_13515, partial [Acidobacteria bacterium]|nr:hypothetical protein [Acidobacteriota bacterium]